LIATMAAAGFDQNWTRSFELVLTDGEYGLNLRNEVGHGLCDCPPRHHVALVLHAALFLLAVVHGVIAYRDRAWGQAARHRLAHRPIETCGYICSCRPPGISDIVPPIEAGTKIAATGRWPG
jgi:hypothetical protein